jgi:hypothetical protein
MSDGGKGSAPRPYSVDKETFSNNWDSIFGKKKPESTTLEMPGTIGSAKIVFTDDKDNSKSGE